MFAGIMAGAVLLGPIVVAVIALWNGDLSALRDSGIGLLYLSILAVALGAFVAAISWYQTGGRCRTNAGAEAATRLTFVATASGLRVGDATGRYFEGPWARWRTGNVRASVAQLRGSRLDILEALDVVMVTEEGARAGRVTLDPQTLLNGRDFAATVVGMIASRGQR